MVDLRTIDEVTVNGCYTVRVGESDDETDRMSAAVIRSDRIIDMQIDDAPIVHAGTKYEAAGRAVDAYLSDDDEDDAEDTDEDDEDGEFNVPDDLKVEAGPGGPKDLADGETVDDS